MSEGTQVTPSPWVAWLTSDRRIPLWLRVVVVAYNNANDDDVLFLDPGELGRLVGVSDRKMLHKAVLRAVEAGFLAERSGTTALRLAPRGEGK